MPDAPPARERSRGPSVEGPPAEGPAALLAAPADVEAPALDACARAVVRVDGWEAYRAEAERGGHDVALVALPPPAEALPREPLVVALTDDADEEAAWLRAGACEVAPPAVLADAAALARVLARTAARREASAARAWAEERYRIMVEHTFDIVAVLDGFGTYVYASPSIEEKIGYAPAELVGQNAFETVHPDDLDRVAAVFMEAVMQPGTTRTLEYRVVSKDGRTVYLEGVGRAIVGPDGQPYGVINSRDVTSRKEAEAALAASEGRYRALLDVLPDAIARVEPDGTIADFHLPPGFGSDVRPSDVVGKKVSEVLPGPLYVLYEETLRRLREAGESFSYRYETTVEGEPHHREVRVVVGGHGEVVAIFRDVTQEVEAADRLREQEDLLRQIVTTVPVVVFAFGRDERLTMAEGRGLERIGVSPAALRGRALTEVYADLPDVRHAAERALGGEPHHGVFEVLGRYFDTHLAPVLDPVGRVSRVIGVAADVTELQVQARALEAHAEALAQRTAELAERSAELERSRAELRELAAHSEEVREGERARLSREVHDVLGQLLTGIRLGTSWLARRLARDPEAAERAEDTLALVDEAIRFSREVAADLRPGVLDDLGLASALEWQAARFSARTGVACAVETTGPEEAVPAEAATAAFRIAQEALTNAARHAEARAVAVRLEVEPPAGEGPGRLRLRVEDDGRGFDPAAPGRPRSLGLLGMRERARILDGDLDVDAAPGAGTRVTLILPLA